MPSPPPLPAKLRAAVLELGLEGARGLVACSGGADSVALLLGLCELAPTLGLGLEVATIDHQLRPGSARDALYVERLARALGLPCHRREVEVRGPGGLEAAARRARYRALEQLAEQRGLSFVATGHTLEDQAETVLLRLARGTGTRGLRGVLRRRGRVVRPLLAVSRAEVRGYLASRRVRGREDPTNLSPEFARNRVRALVLPALVEALGPAALASIARSASVAEADERLLSRLARRRAARLLAPAPGELFGGETAALRRLPESLRARVLRLGARRAGLRLGALHVRRMLGLLEAGRPSRLSLPGGAEFRVRYGRFALCPAAATAPAPAPLRLEIPGPGCWQGAGARVEVREVAAAGPPAEGAIRLDPSGLRLPLELRTRRPGDRFRPRGGRGKKLKSWLIDRKLPRERRGGLWLLADAAGEVLWVVGLRDSQQAALGERAERAWEVRVGAPGSSPEPRLLSSGGGSPGGAGRAPETQAPEGLSDSVQEPK